MIEKPLARTSTEALAFAAEAEAADRQVMCGMCMRFWPGWTWLKRTIDEQPWGRVLGATFRRVGGVPGSPFYRQGERSGGAILDLHLHDTDFVRHCFGVPATVTSTGYTRLSGEIDHVVTRYGYGADGPMVVAEGAWIEADGVAFDMRFEVVFERAVARYALGSETPLWLYRPGAPPQVVEVEATLGHEAELAYFVDCVRAGRSPEVVTLREAAESIAIVEHEVRSVRAGGPVEVVLA
jgi:predicted dehydrogenase